MSNKDPEEIYLEPQSDTYAEEGRMWCEDNAWDSSDYDGNEPVKYIRADLAQLNPWISVNSELPPPSKDLWISTSEGCFVAQYEGPYGIKCWPSWYLPYAEIYLDDSCEVYAWFSLPQPYKGE